MARLLYLDVTEAHKHKSKLTLQRFDLSYGKLTFSETGRFKFLENKNVRDEYLFKLAIDTYPGTLDFVLCVDAFGYYGRALPGYFGIFVQADAELNDFWKHYRVVKENFSYEKIASSIIQYRLPSWPEHKWEIAKVLIYNDKEAHDQSKALSSLKTVIDTMVQKNPTTYHDAEFRVRVVLSDNVEWFI